MSINPLSSALVPNIQVVDSESFESDLAPAFYERAWVGRLIGSGFLTASFVGAGACIYHSKALYEQTTLFPVLAIFSIIYLTQEGLKFIEDPYYKDPSQRKHYANELQSKQLTLEEFIQKHSWARIVRYGFHIPEDHSPVISKKEICKQLFEKAGDHPSKLFTQVDLKLDPFPHFPLSLGLLWQTIHYGALGEEELHYLQELFSKEKDLTASILLENYSYLRTFGFLKGLSKEKQAWLSNHLGEYEKIKTYYLDMASRSFKLYHSKLNAAKVEKSSRRASSSINHHVIGNLFAPRSGKKNDWQKGISIGNDVYLLYNIYDSDQTFLARVEEAKQTLIEDLEKFNSYFSHHMIRLNQSFIKGVQ